MVFPAYQQVALPQTLAIAKFIYNLGMCTMTNQ